MATRRLTVREQRILDELERGLRKDRALRGRLLGLGVRTRLRHALRACEPHGRLVAVLFLASMGLLASGLATADTGVIWAFAACWLLTTLAAFRAVFRWMTAQTDRTHPPKPFV
ncbi:DUF3040 domain-containing protein [Streptomyces sp. NPDC004838]